MNKLNLVDFEGAIQYIDKTGCGVVYPLSIAEMVQSGDIFTSKHSALFWHYSGFAFIYRYKKILQSAEIDNHNFHKLRHTFATNCAEKGFDVKTLSAILGHSTVNLTIPVPNSNTKPTQYLPIIMLISKGRSSCLYARNLPHFFRYLIQFPSAKFTIFFHCFSAYCMETYDYAVNGLEIDDNTELVLSENNVCVSHLKFTN